MFRPRSDRPADDSQEWVVVRTAPDQITAEIWQEMLKDEGIPAMLSPADVVSFLGTSFIPCRLLVPSTSLDAAKAVLEGELWQTEVEAVDEPPDGTASDEDARNDG
jgi:hypothetical protein